MIEFFVRRPVTTVMLVTVFVVLGVVSYFNLSIESMPDIDFPFVTVKVVYPGASPIEVETQVIKKIEDAVSEISGIEKIQSRSNENFGFVFIQFILESDVDIKAIEVKDKVEPIINDLPSGAERPIIQKFDPFDAPVLELILSSETLDGRTLYEYTDKKLKHKFTAIDGIASVDISGGKIRQINVELDPKLMKKRYMTINDVISAITVKNQNIPGGQIDARDNTLNIRFIGEFQTLDEIENMALVARDGSRFKLKDIGVVKDSFEKVESIARFNGFEAVGIGLKKVSGGNSVDVGRAALAALGNIQKGLPKGMKLVVGTDETKFILEETRSTEMNILLGIILTIAVLLFFTGRVRSTIIASIVIPTSIISSYFLMDFSEFTINMMTLLAFATALGTLIANAIVIIENVLEHIERGKNSVDAAIDATKEVSTAVFAAAGTNLVVFTPLAFMGGIVGKFMLQFGMTVVYATIFSIIASFSLTPMLCAVFFRSRNNNHDNGEESNESKEGGERPVVKKRAKVLSFLGTNTLRILVAEYKHIFNLMFRFPFTTLVVVIGGAYFSFQVASYIGFELFPAHDEDKINIHITMPQGTTIDKTLEISKEVEQIVAKIPEVKSYLTNIGANGIENSRITLNLISSLERERSDFDIINELLPKISKIPDAEIDLVRGDGHGPASGDVTINVHGHDYPTLVKESKEVIKVLEKSGYFRSVTSSYKNPKDEVRFIPSVDKLTYYGFTNAQVAGIIRNSIYGEDSNLFKEEGQEYKINVALSEFYKSSKDDLKEINIISKKGLIPITELGTLEVTKSLPTIWHRDKERVIQIDGYLSKSTAGQVRNILDKDLDKIKFIKDHGYRHAGNAEFLSETFKEIIKAGIIAIILTYMALAAILNSFIYPFVIVTSIATSVTGVVLFLFFSEHSINIGSMLAMIMLVGLVVNNAILMLDYAIKRIKEGTPIIEALWLGASVKFRAILMTSIAIVFGILPQLRAVMLMKASMGAVIMGGMLASIVFTFVLIPIVFWYFERAKQFAFKLLG